MDKRDSQTWVAVELTHLGEQRAAEGTLGKFLRKELGVDDDWPVFIPSVTYIKDGRKTTVHLMEGYAFVATGLPETTYFALERKANVTQVLSVRGSKGMRALHVLRDDRIQEIRHRMRALQAESIPIGSKVIIMDGTYSALHGSVVDVEGDMVQVCIMLRSLNIIATIPRNFLEVEAQDG